MILECKNGVRVAGLGGQEIFRCEWGYEIGPSSSVFPFLCVADNVGRSSGTQDKDKIPRLDVRCLVQSSEVKELLRQLRQ